MNPIECMAYGCTRDINERIDPIVFHPDGLGFAICLWLCPRHTGMLMALSELVE